MKRNRPPVVEPLPNGGWAARFWYTTKEKERVRFRRKICSSGSKREAEKLARELQRQANELGYVPLFEPALAEEERPGGPLPMSKALTMFEELHVKVHNAKSEQANKAAIFRDHIRPYFVETLGDPDVRDIKKKHCLAFQASLQRTTQKRGRRKGTPLSPGRINKITDVVRTLFTWLDDLDEYDMGRSPMRKVDHLGVREYEAQTWSGEQLLRFTHVCREQEPHWLPFYVFVAYTGVRHGEAVALRKSDLHLDEAYARIQRSEWRGTEKETKGKRNRSVPLVEPLVDMLREMKETGTSDHVFLTKKGEPLTENSVRKPFKRICEAAGVPVIRIHDLRHSYATLLHTEGTPLDVVQKLLGHSTIQMTQRYAKTPDTMMRQAVNGLPQLDSKRESDKKGDKNARGGPNLRVVR